MDRMNPIQSVVQNLASDLRTHGYCSVSSEEDADKYRPYLISEFKTLLYIEVDESRKYFIVDKTGKDRVLKSIETSMYYQHRLKVAAEKLKNPIEKFVNELSRLEKLKRNIVKVKL